MTPASVPSLPRGVRRHHDRVRNVPVLLAPERVLMLDAIGVAVLEKLDGTATIADISSTLAEEYAAPVEVIRQDVIEYPDDLVAKRLVEVSDG